MDGSIAEDFPGWFIRVEDEGKLWQNEKKKNDSSILSVARVFTENRA